MSEEALPEGSEMEEICFQIIANVGGAKSAYIEAIRAAKTGKFDEARELLSKGDEFYNLGHDVHLSLLQEDAARVGAVTMSLLLTHAEDQMMQAETFRLFAEELIDAYETLGK